MRKGSEALLTWAFCSLSQLPGSTDSAASFEFIDENHTLGNALRYVIMKKYASFSHFVSFCFLFFPFVSHRNRFTNTTPSPDVEFCAYAIPHPSEPKMNLRIQTYGKHTNLPRPL